MIRIAAINQDRGVGPERAKGAAVHLRAMREAFTGLGCEVQAFDEHRPGKLNRRLREAGSRPFDLLYERYALGCDAAARFAAEQKIPLVLEVNAPLAEEAARFRGVEENAADEARDRFLFSRADCVLAVSSAVADYARARGARPESIMVRPNGVDTARFNPRAGEGQERLTPANAFVLGFHGRVRPWHGFGSLVEAAARLLQDSVPAHLLVVGEGEFPELQNLPGRNYTQLGWQPHERMPALVAAFDVLPLTYGADLPCYFSPLKLMEAMACGVVPVVPDLGDLPQLVRHGVNGLVYPAGDVGRLVSLLAELARSPGLRAELARQATATAAGHSWAGIAADVLRQVTK